MPKKTSQVDPDVAYDAGGAAFTDEKKRSDNPYNDPDLRGAWFDGWDDAADAAADGDDEDEDDDDEEDDDDFDDDEDEDEDEDEG